MVDLELQRKSLPDEPGVYLFKDKDGKIIYIGKAINLKKRVSQYFLKTTYNDPYYEEKINELVKRITSLEFIVTENEKEAYLLENVLIKKHLPRFNVIMRDSKTYPWVAIFYTEEFPRIRIIRGPEKYSQDNVFLGPYTDKKEIMRILRDLRKIFPYCSCKKKVRKKDHPCLYYQLKLCPGPCIGSICKEEYIENVKKIELFLRGETEELKREISNKMETASKNLNFEMAAFWRDKYEAIENSTRNQYIIFDQGENKDIIGYNTDKNYAALTIIHIRDNKLSNKSQLTIDLNEKVILKEEILSSLLTQFYQNVKGSLPEIIIISELYNGVDLLQDLLKNSNKSVQIRTPIGDNEQGLLRIANKNAKVMVDQQIQMEQIRQKGEDQIGLVLKEAKKTLHLSKEPRIIEGFDISNIEGTDPTGSMVYFLEGRPYNKNYRHFKIRSKSTPDDVAMMKEVIRRRYSFLLKTNGDLPDLVLVDGGKGQLNAALSVLNSLNLGGIPVIGLAKRLEEIYLPGEKEPITLPKGSALLKLFQRVRDEAHRFALKLQKKQRKQRVTGSALDNIRGIGPATRNKLLLHFKSLEEVKRASLEELTRVVGKKAAETLMKNLK